MAFNGAAGIHGIDPSEYGSIGHDASHGCVRMRIPDVIASTRARRSARPCTWPRTCVRAGRPAPRSRSSAAASAGCPRRCLCCTRASTSTSTSRRRAQRDRRRHPDQPERLARAAPARPGRRAGARRASARWPCTSGAGTTAAPCCAPPWATPSSRRFGAPYYHIHRADLLAALAGALPPERVHLGHRLDRARRARRPRRGAVRQRRARRGRRAGRRRRHPLAVRAGCSAPRSRVHRLRRLARAGAGRAARHLGIEVDRADLDGAGGAFRALLRVGPAAGELRRRRRAGQLDARVLDRPGDVAEALAASRAGIRRCADLGAVDETFIWALFDRLPLPRWSRGPRHPAGRCLPSDAAVHGPGRRAGDRGRGRAAASLARGARRPGGAAPLRGDPHAARHAPAGVSTANKTRFHLPDGEQQRSATPDGGRRDRLRFKAVAWIYEHDAAAATTA